MQHFSHGPTDHACRCCLSESGAAVAGLFRQWSPALCFFLELNQYNFVFCQPQPVFRMPDAIPFIVTNRASRKPGFSGSFLSLFRISTCSTFAGSMYGLRMSIRCRSISLFWFSLWCPVSCTNKASVIVIQSIKTKKSNIKKGKGYAFQRSS